MIALSGVRSSCDMLARNSDLCLFATLELPALVLDLAEQPAFWIAITAWSAKVLSSSGFLARTGRRTVAAHDNGARCHEPSHSIGATIAALIPAACLQLCVGTLGHHWIATDVRVMPDSPVQDRHAGGAFFRPPGMDRCARSFPAPAHGMRPAELDRRRHTRLICTSLRRRTAARNFENLVEYRLWYRRSNC